MRIIFSHLTHNYGAVRALDDVSLTIDGGMFGLLGPNGAGKTTLMRILATLLLPTAGQVTVGEFDVARDPAAVRCRLGYIPQDFGFYRNLTAYQLLDYVGTMKNLRSAERRQQVTALLEEVNLADAARRKVGGFSGGMKQRLGIAQALLGDPELLVVDEPTAGLDPEERIRFRNLLARLSRERTVLLSTHIVADIEASCSGVAVLDRGRLAFTGTTDDLTALAMGKVWHVEVDPGEWMGFERRYAVLSSRAHDGRMLARVIADHDPLGAGIPAQPAVEDGYVAVMRGLGGPGREGRHHG